MKKARVKRERDIIGWREIVGLPELGIPQIKAKIDSGARTSALHAEDREVFEKNGEQWVRFRAPKVIDGPPCMIEAPIVSRRDIKNTSGVPERRLIIRTLLLLGRHHWRIELSLADRDAMKFDLIIGRTALKGRNILVDPGRSFLSDQKAGSRQLEKDDLRSGVLRTLK